MGAYSSRFQSSADESGGSEVEFDTGTMKGTMEIERDAAVHTEEEEQSEYESGTDGDGSGYETCPEDKRRSKYLTLLKAVIRGDWGITQMFFDLDPDAITAGITSDSKTPLHVAVGRGAPIEYVTKLVGMMSPEQLEAADEDKKTVLHEAAVVGNVIAAKLLVERNARLPFIRDSADYVPLNWAAYYGHKEMISYLLQVTKNDGIDSPFEGETGLHIINNIIYAEYYDIGLKLAQSYPGLVRWEPSEEKSTLLVLAEKPSAFRSGSRFRTWQRLIYYWAPIKLKEDSSDNGGRDIENQIEHRHNLCCSQLFKEWLKTILWKFFERIVPPIKQIRKKKSMHHQSVQLVRRLCKEVEGLNFSEDPIIFKEAILTAADNGIHEIIEEIVDSVPFSLWFWDDQDRSIFAKAIVNRHENVFNLLYQMSEYKHIPIESKDADGNNILHLAGKLAPPHQLNRMSGAALQMQRELQWYKEVEKFVQPSAKKQLNGKDQTPGMLFTEEHKDLVRKGEEWLKSTANSCTIAAALIATVVFAAAITVPGGYKSDSGLPILYQEKAFVVFAISDTLSLFSSTAAVLMFLSILTARCSESDFLYALPKRLILGQLTLFLSISSMMIAFSAIIYLLFGNKQSWTLIMVCFSACLPITLFATLQFPLLLTMIKSTYIRSIFGKKSDRVLY